MTDIQGNDSRHDHEPQSWDEYLGKGTSVLIVTLMPPDGQCGQNYTESILQLHGHPATAEALMAGGGPMFIPTTPLRISEMRNGAVKYLLDESTAEWLLFIDSDMGFQPDALELLLAAADPQERPVIGALCFGLRKDAKDGLGGWEGVAFPTIFDWKQIPDQPRPGFVQRYDFPMNTVTQVAATGAAFLLIHRSALEAVRQVAGDTWFERAKTHPEDDLMGEDISFCARLGHLGIPVFVHTGVETNHLKTIHITQKYYRAQRALMAIEAAEAGDE